MKTNKKLEKKERVQLCGVLPTVESDLEVSGPLQSLTLWCPAYRGIRFGGVWSTAESDSVVSCLLWNQIWRCPVHCRVRLCGVLPTLSQR